MAPAVLLHQGTLRLVISYKRPGESYVQGPSGRGAGEIQERGTVEILGREIPKQVLVYEGKDKSVFYRGAFENLELYIQLDDEPGPGFDYPVLEVPLETQIEVDEILRTIALN
jgi:hypothetical protein